LAVLHIWTKQPWNMEAFFAVLCIFQWWCGWKSKHIVEVLVVKPGSVPGFSDSDILVVILHLPCFVCSLAIQSLDIATQSSGAKCHLDLADWVVLNFFSSKMRLTCFAMTGSKQDGKLYMPCGTGCHLGCIVVGEPFCTHMAKNKGLMYHKVGIAHPLLSARHVQ
jgi:hypothetical protein